jgi:hypothetical protein
VLDHAGRPGEAATTLRDAIALYQRKGHNVSAARAHTMPERLGHRAVHGGVTATPSALSLVACKRASRWSSPRRSQRTAMKEGLLGGTLTVSSRSEPEEARVHVARWIGSESTQGRRLSYL